MGFLGLDTSISKCLYLSLLIRIEDVLSYRCLAQGMFVECVVAYEPKSQLMHHGHVNIIFQMFSLYHVSQSYHVGLILCHPFPCLFNFLSFCIMLVFPCYYPIWMKGSHGFVLLDMVYLIRCPWINILITVQCYKIKKEIKQDTNKIMYIRT